MARIGYTARGLVFVLIGGFAGLAAFGSGRPVGTRGVLHKVLAQPMGDLLIWMIAGGAEQSVEVLALPLGIVGTNCPTPSAAGCSSRVVPGIMDIDELAQQPEPLCRQRGREQGHTRHVAAWSVEAGRRGRRSSRWVFAVPDLYARAVVAAAAIIRCADSPTTA